MAYTSPPHPAYYGFTSATPSPSGPHGFAYQRPGPSPRQHSRHASNDFGFSSPSRSYPSPRYSSTGYYSTRAGHPTSPSGEAEYVSAKARKPKHSYGFSWSAPPPKPTRRFSKSYRASYGDSDDDEYFVWGDHVYIVPGRRATKASYKYHGHGTNHYYQGFTYDRDGTPIIIAEPTGSPRYDPETRRPRRQSTSTPTPTRPSTAPRPSSSHKKSPPHHQKPLRPTRANIISRLVTH